MRFAITILIIIKVSLISFAQNKSEEDSIYVRKIISEGEEVYGHDNQSAFQKWIKAEKICIDALKKFKNGNANLQWNKLYSIATNNLGVFYNDKGNIAKALEYYSLSLKSTLEIKDTASAASTYNNIAYIYYERGENKKALENFEISLKYAEYFKDSNLIPVCLNNMAMIYEKMANYSMSMKYYQRALKINELIKNYWGIGNVNNNIAFLYQNKNQLDIALKYFQRGLEARIKAKQIKGIAQSYANIGNIFRLKKDYVNAKKYLEKSLEERFKLNDIQGIGNSLANIAMVAENENKPDSALLLYQRSTEYYLKVNYKNGIASNYLNISLILEKKQKYSQSLLLAEKGFQIANELGFPDLLSMFTKLLARLYSNNKEYKKAYEMQLAHQKWNDSLLNLENEKFIIRKNAEMEIERNNLQAKLEKEKNDLLNAQEIKKRNTQRNIFIGGFLLMLFSTMVFFSQKKQIQKEKKITEEQKLLIDNQHKEIKDSIVYAKRIQNAILPDDKFVKQILPESFIFYLPKDIVAGDFYWIEKDKDTVYFAVCDCTGHGVPGAMVSVVCYNALNRAFHEFKNRDTAALLEKTRKLVKENFSMSNEEINDGMDVCLIAINVNAFTLQYSGANNPLWLFRRNDNQFDLMEFKPTKNCIGQNYVELPFLSHQIALQKHDRLFMFTDGFADQTGGNPSKKLSRKKFKQYITESCNLDISAQKNSLVNAFQNHKGDEEQLDDVCLVGVEVQ